MLRFETDFEPAPFEKHLVEQTKEDVFQRLEGHILGFLRIVLRRRPGGFTFRFFGDGETVEKAKRLLDVH